MNFLKENYSGVIKSSNENTIIFCILLFTSIVFSKVFAFSEFLTYDDNWYIYENQNVINLSWESIKNIFTSVQGGQYSPLGEVYHAVLYAVFGKNAIAFKVFALIVHLLNTFFLFKILRSLFADHLMIIVVVLIFAIHPMQVETIGWLSVIFRNAVTLMLIGYIFYIKYLQSDRKIVKLIPVIICYILAFLTKEQAILFPVGLFLIHQLYFTIKLDKKFFVEMLFWGILALIFGLITIEITKTGGPNIANNGQSLGSNMTLLAQTFFSYSYNFLVPHQLSFSYPYPVSGASYSFMSFLLFLGLLGLGVFFSYKNLNFAFGFLWMMGFLSLGLAFAFFHLRDTFMADRYIYIAIIGFSIIFYLGVDFLYKSLKLDSFKLITLAIIIIVFSITSFKRVEVFKDNKSLWSQAVKVNPSNSYAYNSLGYYYRNTNNLDSAAILYKKAISLNPTYYLAHSNLTMVYYKKKQYDSALFHVNKAIALNPEYQQAYENRAVLHLVMGKKDLYFRDLNKLLKFSPNNSKYLLERAQVHFKAGDYQKGLEDALKVIKLSNSSSAKANYLAGHIYIIKKKYNEADSYLSKAIQLEPKEAKNYYWRSIARVSLNKWKTALKDALIAKKLGYKVAPSYLNLLQREVLKQNDKTS